MSKLWKLLNPTWVVSTVQEAGPEALKARGITAIITDLDNTLVPWRHFEIAPGVIEWLAALEAHNIKICIASNTVHMTRLKQLAETMGIPYVTRVHKPRLGGFLRAMRLMGSNRRNTAVFGDQIFTDILAGNRLGLVTILLRPPLSKEEFFSTQMVRVVENVVIRRLQTRGMWPVAEKVEKVLEKLPDPRTPTGRRLTRRVLGMLLLMVAGSIYLLIRRKR